MKYSAAKLALDLLRGRIAALRRRLGAFARCTGGGVAAIVAILSPVLIGGMGLGAEAGYWYLTARKVQNAADVAAHGVMIRKNAGDSTASLQALANYITKQADVDLATSTVTLRLPPTTGTFSGNPNAAEVEITRTVPRLLTAVYSNQPLDISARAVARAQNLSTNVCVLALSKTGGGQGIDIADRAVVTADGCNLYSNEAGPAGIELHKDSKVTAKCLHSAGNAITTGSLTMDCASVETNAAVLPDPLGSLAEPAVTGPCANKVVQNTTVTPTVTHPSGMKSIRYCDGMEIAGNVTLNPGLYIIEKGDLTILGGANVTGTGVMFYLENQVQAVFSIDGTFSLSPPTSGPYAGMTIFARRSASGKKHVLAGKPGSVLNGTVYAQNARLEFFGQVNATPNGCTQLIADDIEFKNDAVYTVNCVTPLGPVATASSGQMTVSLVE